MIESYFEAMTCRLRESFTDSSSPASKALGSIAKSIIFSKDLKPFSELINLLISLCNIFLLQDYLINLKGNFQSLEIYLI